ncbi:(2Fe-2S)-binding protein [Persicitalea jodogahamensis]|uniref:Oxidoreductase n=1 Tax=Persicitalea jodogahamensis TaxID=402147 RepID=A0A8J3DBR4_9BACT|nr:(2Fe-2S)-binding protein [Persicitalea jodogahamensis]GHB73611.1 oxidoreductase [Persicitalea jodogahamensis]
MIKDVTLQVNGQTRTVRVDPATPLLYVLRNQLELNGPKYGCGIEVCGSCMVLMDGQAMPSCRIPVEEMTGREIVTLEGLTHSNGTLHPVQSAFVEEQAAQCGYCLNGMVIAAVALLKNNKKPDEAAIREGMDRNLCRCGTHTRMIKAIQRAADAS